MFEDSDKDEIINEKTNNNNEYDNIEDDGSDSDQVKRIYELITRESNNKSVVKKAKKMLIKRNREQTNSDQKSSSSSSSTSNSINEEHNDIDNDEEEKEIHQTKYRKISTFESIQKSETLSLVLKDNSAKEEEKKEVEEEEKEENEEEEKEIVMKMKRKKQIFLKNNDSLSLEDDENSELSCSKTIRRQSEKTIQIKNIEKNKMQDNDLHFDYKCNHNCPKSKIRYHDHQLMCKCLIPCCEHWKEIRHKNSYESNNRDEDHKSICKCFIPCCDRWKEIRKDKCLENLIELCLQNLTKKPNEKPKHIYVDEYKMLFENILDSDGLIAGGSIVYALNPDFVPINTIGDIDIFCNQFDFDKILKLITTFFGMTPLAQPGSLCDLR